MALVVLSGRDLLPLGGLPVVAQLVLLTLVGVATYAALGFAFARQSFQDVFRFFRRRREARRDT